MWVALGSIVIDVQQVDQLMETLHVRRILNGRIPYSVWRPESNKSIGFLLPYRVILEKSALMSFLY